MADTDYWHKCATAYGIAGIFDINLKGSLYHVLFNSDPYVHINQPVTELIQVELQPGQEREKIEAIISKEFAEREQLLNDGRVSRGRFTWGNPKETDQVFVIMTGWDSIEVRVCHICLIADCLTLSIGERKVQGYARR